MVKSIHSVPLKFRLGEITAGEITRTLVVRNENPFLHREPATKLEKEFDALPAGVDGVVFRSVPVEDRLETLTFGAGRVRYVPRQYERYFVNLDTSHEDYVQSFSRKTRSSLRRKVRKFQEAAGGEISFRSYKTVQEVEEFHRLAREVSSESYQERLLDAGLPDDDVFRREMMAAAAEDRVRGYLIFLEDEVLAYLYCPVRDGIVSYAFLGYRSRFSHLSPGTVLLWLAIEDLFSEKQHRIFDFTEGGDRSKHSQKRLFSTGGVSCADIYLFRASFSNVTIVTAHAATEWLVERVGGLLESIGIKHRVRGLLRRAWRPG